MQRFSVGALVLVCAVLCTPPVTAQTINAPLRVQNGDAFTVDVVYTQSTEIGEQPVDVTMNYTYAMHVVDAAEGHWRFVPISIGYEMPNVPGIDAEAVDINWPAMSDMMSAMMRIGTDVGFDCRVDGYGRCIEMTNWPFWSTRLENLVIAFDGVARMMPESSEGEEAVLPVPAPPHRPKSAGDVDADVETLSPGAAPPMNWERVRIPVLQGVARLIDGFDTRDAGAAMAGIYLPAFVQGRTLTRREAVSFVDEYDMPFGAPPLRYNASLTLDRIDRRANTAMVTRRATLDEESVRTSLASMTSFASEAFLTPLAAELGEEGQQMPTGEALGEMLNAMLSDLAYEETTRGVIDLSTGMARETTTDYTVSVRVVAEQEPVTMHGRIVTRVTAGAPDMPRLPRQ